MFKWEYRRALISNVFYTLAAIVVIVVFWLLDLPQKFDLSASNYHVLALLLACIIIWVYREIFYHTIRPYLQISLEELENEYGIFHADPLLWARIKSEKQKLKKLSKLHPGEVAAHRLRVKLSIMRDFAACAETITFIRVLFFLYKILFIVLLFTVVWFLAKQALEHSGGPAVLGVCTGCNFIDQMYYVSITFFTIGFDLKPNPGPIRFGQYFTIVLTIAGFLALNCGFAALVSGIYARNSALPQLIEDYLSSE